MIESPVLESKHIGTVKGPRKLSALEPSWRAWSIWEVYEKDARSFFAGAMIAQGMMKLLDNEIVAGRFTMQDFLPDGTKSAISGRLEEAAVIFEEMGATASYDYVRRVQGIFEQRIKVHTADCVLQIIGSTFYDEMARWKIIFLNKNEVAMYDHGEVDTFGQEVIDAFPSAAFNMAEACKCFALNRWSATAYHCIGVLEVGIKALCKELNAGVDFEETNVTWKKIQDKIRARITEKGQDAAPRKVSHPNSWAQDEAFFSECLLDLRNLGKAYRNPTMHFRTVVDVNDNQARRIVESTASFMRYLTEKVRENP